LSPAQGVPDRWEGARIDLLWEWVFEWSNSTKADWDGMSWNEIVQEVCAEMMGRGDARFEGCRTTFRHRRHLGPAATVVRRPTAMGRRHGRGRWLSPRGDRWFQVWACPKHLEHLERLTGLREFGRR